MAGGQLKYRCLAVGVIPFSRDLHLEQSPKACHSMLAQEIEADSDLMRKVNLPNFYETLVWKEPCNFGRNMKALSANHPLTGETGALRAQQPISLCAAGVKNAWRESCPLLIPQLGGQS